MFAQMRLLLGAFAAAAVLAGCATTPPNVQPLAPNADPLAEIQKTDEMLKEARAQQYDVMSPNNFTEAEKSLNKAKKYTEKGKTTEKILEQVAYSRAWLKLTNEKAALAESVMKDITDARAGAMKAGAPQYFEKDWKKAGNQLENITGDIEKGNLRPADKRGQTLTQTFRDLERRAVGQTYLGRAYDNIEKAEKVKADEIAPRTYSATMTKMNAAQKVIAADPKNTEAIRQVSEVATLESMHLLDVTSKVHAGNSEELVLLAERQKRQISGLKTETAMTEAQLNEAEKAKVALGRKEALLRRAEMVRSELKPSEAEVFAQGDSLMIRLKGLQFPTNQATLGPRNQALLKKVRSALEGIQVSKIRIEGHTDSIGSEEKNRVLSQKRAEAVENYILANGVLSSNQIEAVGMGYDSPIGDNATQTGRAQNRRIDLLIEPKMDTAPTKGGSGPSRTR
jgi:outer membrane protein OmpA-like peptidoglycan-associated protein